MSIKIITEEDAKNYLNNPKLSLLDISEGTKDLKGYINTQGTQFKAFFSKYDLGNGKFLYTVHDLAFKRTIYLLGDNLNLLQVINSQGYINIESELAEAKKNLITEGALNTEVYFTSQQGEVTLRVIYSYFYPEEHGGKGGTLRAVVDLAFNSRDRQSIYKELSSITELVQKILNTYIKLNREMFWFSFNSFLASVKSYDTLREYTPVRSFYSNYQRSEYPMQRRRVCLNTLEVLKELDRKAFKVSFIAI